MTERKIIVSLSLKTFSDKADIGGSITILNEMWNPSH